MEPFRKGCVIACGNLLQWKKDSRVAVTFLLMAVLLVRYLIGLTVYGVQNHTTVTPFLLPILFKDSTVSNGLLKVLLYLGLICLLCDAPFLSERLPYELIRSGRRAWWMGECLYLWCASLLYLLFLMFGAALVVLPTVSVSELWGSTIPALLKEESLEQVLYLGALEIPTELINVIYPYGAQILSFFAGWLSFVLIGHVIYLVNLCTAQRVWGVGLAVLLVMWDPVVRYWGTGARNRWLYLVSPVSWSSIESWTILGYGHPISMGYAYGMYGAGILTFTVLIAVVSKRKALITEEREAG